MNVLSLLGFGCKYKKKNKTNKEMSKKIANDTVIRRYGVDPVGSTAICQIELFFEGDCSNLSPSAQPYR